MKWDAEKKRVLPALQFSINREPGHLAALKRDKGPMCIKGTTTPRKKAPRKNKVNRKTRSKHARGQSADKRIKSFYPSARDISREQGNSRIEYTKAQRQRGRFPIGWGRMLWVKFSESSRIFRRAPKSFRTFWHTLECSRIS